MSLYIAQVNTLNAIEQMNNGISVLVIEDEEIWANEIQLMLKELGFTVEAVSNNVEDALNALRTIDYDIALLDIYLNGKNSGLELGKMLFEFYHKPFIFITSSDTHSLTEAVKCKPSAYLIKPANKASLFVTIQSAIQNFNTHKTPQGFLEKEEPALSHFFIKQGNHFKKIEWKNVWYLSSRKNYTKAVVKDNEQGYLFRSSIQKTINNIIPASINTFFVQINRSEVINISFAEELRGNELITSFGKFIISETYIDAVKKKLNIVV